MSKHDFQHPLSRVMPSRPMGPMRVPARALGWFSLVLGIAELAMPRRVSRIAGAPALPALTRVYGLREIGTGIGLLTSKDPTPWLWGRVVGDVIDVATVGAGLVTQRRPARTLASVAALLAVAWVDFKVAEAAPPAAKRSRRALHDYSDRSGFPRPAAEMRGVARKPSTPASPAVKRGAATSQPGSVATAVAGAGS